MKNFTNYYGYEHYIPANNLSKGFHGVLFAYLKQYHKANDQLLLIAENEAVLPVFNSYFPALDITCQGYGGEKGEEFHDLNIHRAYMPQYNLVLSQALLEHICMPCVAIRNMADLLHKEGYIFIHTHNLKMGYHAFPVDCVRFHKDFFVELQKYIPIKLIEFDEWAEHIFICYQKL